MATLFGGLGGGRRAQTVVGLVGEVAHVGRRVRGSGVDRTLTLCLPLQMADHWLMVDLEFLFLV